jgi:hypothetical protein
LVGTSIATSSSDRSSAHITNKKKVIELKKKQVLVPVNTKVSIATSASTGTHVPTNKSSTILTKKTGTSA